MQKKVFAGKGRVKQQNQLEVGDLFLLHITCSLLSLSDENHWGRGEKGERERERVSETRGTKREAAIERHVSGEAGEIYSIAED